MMGIQVGGCGWVGGWVGGAASTTELVVRVAPLGKLGIQVGAAACRVAACRWLQEAACGWQACWHSCGYAASQPPTVQSLLLPAPAPPLQYRAVPCNYQPANPAPKIANPTPGERSTQRPLPAACLLCVAWTRRAACASAPSQAPWHRLTCTGNCCLRCCLLHPSLQASIGPARR
jgi:hypothetical protein